MGELTCHRQGGNAGDQTSQRTQENIIEGGTADLDDYIMGHFIYDGWLELSKCWMETLKVLEGGVAKRQLPSSIRVYLKR